MSLDPSPTAWLSLPDLVRATRGGDGVTMEPAMRLALEASFGSVEAWRADLTAVAQASRGTADWAVLAFDPATGRLVHRGAAGAALAPAIGTPLLALDLHESVGAGLASIAWAGTYARYQAAVHAASAPHAAGPEAVAGALLIDVRRAGVYAAAATRIPGAQWRDPAAVGTWAAALPTDRAVLVYCVYGHEVGRSTALRLRGAGVDARFLDGGIDAWQSAGRPVVPKDDPEAPG
ncbi:MAG: rhodanese-like domain-containing protein [Burkholderiaceae bacterium]